MTRTSNEFGRLYAPATTYTKSFDRPRINVNSLPARNNKDTPFCGNWTLKRLEPSSIVTPAGARFPKQLECFDGLPSVKDSLHKSVRYNPEKIGLMIQE